MEAARVSWVGPPFLSTIRQEMPCRFSSAAMNRPAGPAPTTNTWVSAAIRYPFVPARRADPAQLSDRQRAVLDIRILTGEKHLLHSEDKRATRTKRPSLLLAQMRSADRVGKCLLLADSVVKPDCRTREALIHSRHNGWSAINDGRAARRSGLLVLRVLARAACSGGSSVEGHRSF